MTSTPIAITILLLAGLALGCHRASEPGDDVPEGSTDSDSDADSDSDTDSDSDSDSDTDTDTDTDSDSDTDDWGDVHGHVQECWDTGGGPECWSAPGSEVVAVDEDSDSFGPAIAGGDGNYVLPLPPGTYEVEARDPDDFCISYPESGVVIGVNESVELDFTLWADIDAPYVYLYPQEAMQVDVTLTPAEGMFISESIPEYGDGWSVWAEPSGLLDGTYDYLFYESTVLWLFQDEQGWAVPAAEIFDWFAEQLPALGLNDDETADFLEYWTIHLPYAPCYRVFPQPLEIVEQEMELLVEPAPDSVLRLWLMIEGADACEPIEAPVVEPFAREGFTVVEWGASLNGLSF